MKISPNVLKRMQALAGVERPLEVPFGLPRLAPGVVPEKERVAVDNACQPNFQYLNTAYAGQGFLGYPFLAELTQRAEYRALSERVAFEMTRKWIRIKSNSDQDKTDEIAVINKKLKDFKARILFRQAAVYDGFFGRGQLYIKMKGLKTQKELQSPLLLSRFKVGKGTLAGLKLIDPIVTFPYDYNSSDALREDYYQPRSWFVLGQRIHDTRMLTFVSRPVPDLLKPAYNFGGMSMSQLGMDTVNNWLRTRDAVNRMICAYSTSGIKTKMSDVLAGGEGDDFLARLEIFMNGRDNQGVMALDKDTEEFFQFNTPLSELSKLQAQAQEHMAAIAHTPLIILTGISPSGLNASSEGEIRVFYDYIHDMQEAIFRQPLETLIKLIQLSEFQTIDDDITFDFEPLMEPDVEKLARIRKSDADACAEYDAIGAVSGMEIRKRLALDPDSGFEGLNVDDPVPDVDPAIELKKAPMLAAVQGVKNPNGFMG